jgi:hypothetical protein
MRRTPMTDCVIPGCFNPVWTAGDTCTECVNVFGSMLRPTATPPLTEEQIRARDAYVERAYHAQRETLRGAR